MLSLNSGRCGCHRSFSTSTIGFSRPVEVLPARMDTLKLFLHGMQVVSVSLVTRTPFTNF